MLLIVLPNGVRAAHIIEDNSRHEPCKRCLPEEMRQMAAKAQLRLAASAPNSTLLSHLLKWIYQQDTRTDSWRSTITNGRVLVQEDLEDSPSLARALPELFAWAYPRARRDAGDETGLPLDSFPEACPWSLDQVLDGHFWPETHDDVAHA